MGKDKKRLICGGLAWSEDKDMKKLNELSKKGWMLSGFSYLSYELKKEEPREYIYCIDSQKVENREEYIDLFKDGGWEYVCNYGDIYFYRALPGTKEIYSDKASLSEKYSYIGNQMKNVIIVLVAIAMGLIPILMIGDSYIKLNFIKEILEFIIIISLAFSLSFTVCYLTIKYKVKKLSNKVV